jgi:8-oxo-dGTP pyrophosphatase MutT (NUDIX family)
MAARKLTGKETRTEALAREVIEEIGSVVAPSMLHSEVLGYRLVPGSGSRYRVAVWQDGEGASVIECSATRLKQLLREDIAEDALA